MQDGFGLYLHAFILADDGKWVVVQQGMNDATRYARRYHWQSDGLASFVEAPHAAIDGPPRGEIVNLTDRRAAPSRAAQLALLATSAPTASCASSHRRQRPRRRGPLLPHLVMPAHHDVRPKDVFLRRLHGALAAAADRGPADFADLLLVPGVGARTVLSLAMVAEVVHGAPCRFADPARFSLAHGGKDRHPYPVPPASTTRRSPSCAPPSPAPASAAPSASTRSAASTPTPAPSSAPPPAPPSPTSSPPSAPAPRLRRPQRLRLGTPEHRTRPPPGQRIGRSRPKRGRFND